MDEKTKRDELVIRIPNFFNWIPEDFKSHMRAARREQLLAVRSLIDAAIERMDEGDKSDRRRGRIDIAVE